VAAVDGREKCLRCVGVESRLRPLPSKSRKVPSPRCPPPSVSPLLRRPLSRPPAPPTPPSIPPHKHSVLKRGLESAPTRQAFHPLPLLGISCLPSPSRGVCVRTSQTRASASERSMGHTAPPPPGGPRGRGLDGPEAVDTGHTAFSFSAAEVGCWCACGVGQGPGRPPPSPGRGDLHGMMYVRQWIVGCGEREGTEGTHAHVWKKSSGWTGEAPPTPPPLTSSS
jgi:hypothetical protein